MSYTLSTQSLPLLLTLPTAKPAAYTLTNTIRLAARHTAILSSLSFATLTTAFLLSPPRIRHPYLLWTALVAGASGALTLRTDGTALRLWGKARDDTAVEVNGEQVEQQARERQGWEFVRAGLSGVGFAMGVVGIWGDGA